MHTVASKPNSKINKNASEDTEFLKLIDHAAKEPYLKYKNAITEAQEIGWFHESLIDSDRHDSRIHMSVCLSFCLSVCLSV